MDIRLQPSRDAAHLLRLPRAVAEEDEENEDRVIYHPNQDKAASKATKAIVVLLLLVTAFITLLITVGGWSNLQGAQIVTVMFIIVFVVMAYFVAKWNR